MMAAVMAVMGRIELPPNQAQVSGCSGKERFPNGQSAWRRARGLAKKRRRGERRRSQANIYHCPYCGGWHIGQERGPRAS